MSEDLPIDRTRVLPASALELKTARASSSGGQHVNKTESDVQLTLDPREVSWIDEGTRLRMIGWRGAIIDQEPSPAARKQRGHNARGCVVALRKLRVCTHEVYEERASTCTPGSAQSRACSIPQVRLPAHAPRRCGVWDHARDRCRARIAP